MRVSPRRSSILLTGLVLCCLAIVAAAQSDQAAAERVLGSQWKQLSRRAGLVFAGTVLSAGGPDRAGQTSRISRFKTDRPQEDPSRIKHSDSSASTLEFVFRVDRPIAGVRSGEIVTIQEWSGASSRERAMRPGEHILIFLYPCSRFGLTSPVGGSLGQVALDSTGTAVAAHRWWTTATVPALPIKLAQLERAIRAARGE